MATLTNGQIARSRLSAAEVAAAQGLLAGVAIPWASVPPAGAVPQGTLQAVSDIGNQGPVYIRAQGGAWHLAWPQVIYVNNTVYAGTNADTAERLLATYPLVPRSFLPVFNWFDYQAIVTKSGAVTTALTTVREGNAGTLSDAAVISAAATPLGTAANRAGQLGVSRIFDSGTNRLSSANAFIVNSFFGASSTNFARPSQQSGVLTDSMVYATVSATLAASGSDAVSVDRFVIRGW